MDTDALTFAAAKEGFLQKYAVNSNVLESTKFLFISHNMKNLNLFATGVLLPSVSIGEALQSTPLVDMYRAGDKIQFEPVTAQFIVDEDLKVYEEIFDWMVGLGFPADREQYSDQKGKGLYADLTIIFMKNSNETNMKVKLYNAFPIFLGPIQFTSGDTPDNPLQTDVTFRYDYFEIERVNA